MRIEYDFDIVGGGFDGAPALAWVDDGQHPPPDVIFVGLCGKGVHCGTRKCRRGVAHVSYWIAGEERPVGAEAYSKQEEFVERDEENELHGRAVYAIGGLLDPRNFGEAARELTPAPEFSTVFGQPLVTASVEEFIRDVVNDEPLRRRHASCRGALLPAGRHDRGWPR